MKADALRFFKEPPKRRVGHYDAVYSLDYTVEEPTDGRDHQCSGVHPNRRWHAGTGGPGAAVGIQRRTGPRVQCLRVRKRRNQEKLQEGPVHQSTVGEQRHVARVEPRSGLRLPFVPIWLAADEVAQGEALDGAIRPGQDLGPLNPRNGVFVFPPVRRGGPVAPEEHVGIVVSPLRSLAD